MAVSASKTWTAGEVLSASDLNSEFLNIYNNGEDLGWPATKAKDLDGQQVTLDSDGDTSMTAGTDDRIDLALAGTSLFRFDGTVATPVNGFDFIAAAAGSEPNITAVGSDTDIDINLVPKGAGTVTVAGSSVLLNIVEDTTPQLGGQLDVNGQALGDGTLELLTFTEIGSAVNHINITNATTANGPLISPEGDDTDIDLLLKGKGANPVKLGDDQISFPDTDGGALQILTTDGSAALQFSTASYAAGPSGVAVLPLPRGHLAGLQLTRSTATNITVAVGSCRAGSSSDADMANFVNSTAAFSKLFDSGGWDAGTGGGGVPSAAGFAAAIDTWHFFALVGSDGSVDFGYDTSSTAANLLADSGVQAALTATIRYRRIASLVSSATPDLPDFFQHGDLFLWDVPVEVYDATADHTSAVTIDTSSGAPELQCEVDLNVHIDLGGSGGHWLHSPLITDTAPSISAAPGVNAGTAGGEPSSDYIRVLQNSSQQLTLRAVGDANTTFRVWVAGWVDTRGRDD